MALYSSTWGLVTDQDATPRPIASEPLATAYKMLAALYETHAPPIANVPVTETSKTDAREYVIPCAPSADGLDYTFRVAGTKTSGALSVTVTISEYVSSSWSALVSSSSTALGAGTDFDASITLSGVDATATALRLEIDAAGASYQVQSIVVYPTGMSAPEAVSPSGYVGAADGLIGSADAPITTEHINRLAESTRAVYRDRKQAIFGMAQPANRTDARLITEASWGYDFGRQRFGTTRAFIPTPNGEADIAVAIWAETTAASDRDVVLRFSAPSKSTVEVVLAASSGGSPAYATDTATIPLSPAGICNIEMLVEADASGRTYPYGVAAWWTP